MHNLKDCLCMTEHRFICLDDDMLHSFENALPLVSTPESHSKINNALRSLFYLFLEYVTFILSISLVS